MTDSAINESLSNRFLALVQDEKLRREFLPPMSDEEIEAVGRLLDPVAANALEWCQRYPILEPSLVVPSAIWATVQLPHFSSAALSTVVRTTLWAVSVDDLFDKHLAPQDTLLGVVRTCNAVASLTKGETPVTNVYGEILAEIKAELSAHPLWLQIQPLWAASLARMLDGMLYEYWLQRHFRDSARGGWLPPLDEYLYFSSHSTTVPHQWVAVLILGQDPSVVPVLPELAALTEQCGVTIRLANDLGSSNREEEEERVNASTIMQQHLLAQEPPLDEEDAARRAGKLIKRRLQEERDQAAALVDGVHTDTQLERGFLRSVDFGIQLYARHDLREWEEHLGTRAKAMITRGHRERRTA